MALPIALASGCIGIFVGELMHIRLSYQMLMILFNVLVIVVIQLGHSQPHAWVRMVSWLGLSFVTAVVVRYWVSDPRSGFADSK